MRPTPKDDRPFFQSCEHRLDYEPPEDLLAPETVDARIDVGAPAIDEDTRDRLTAHFAAIANARGGARVLVSPSADATWDAVVRVLAALREGRVRYVALTEPDEDAVQTGVRVDGRWPPDREGSGQDAIAAAEQRATWRILGER